MAHTKKDKKGLREPVILAIETATTCGSIGLVADKNCVAEFSLQTGETHSRRLLAGVHWVLQETGLDWQAIDAVAVSLGPGSFTGLRIGLATAKALTMAAGIKLIGVGTLDGLAAQILAPGNILICPVLDARKKEVYGGFYRCDEQGIPRLQEEWWVMRPEKLCDRIREPVLLLGDGAVAYKDLFRDRLGDLLFVAPQGTYFPRAASIGMLAAEKWQMDIFIDPVSAEPIYIRASEAELHLGK